SILSLYDPDRAHTVTRAGQISTWAAFTHAMARELEAKRGTSGEGVRLLTGTVTSPTLIAQIREFLRQFPEARWHQHEPVSRDGERLGTAMLFGRPLDPVYRFD